MNIFRRLTREADKSRAAILLLCACLYPGLVSAAASQVFVTDFESGTPAEFGAAPTSSAGIGSEAVNQGLSAYLGRFTQTDEATLSLTGLPAHTRLRVEFDLYLFETWDGSEANNGPDYFSLSDGMAFAETFTNHHGTAQDPNQSYPVLGDVFLNNDGTALSSFGDGGSTQAFFCLGPQDSHSSFVVDHNATDFNLTFGGPTNQPDEQWGIDNVRVMVAGDGDVFPESRCGVQASRATFEVTTNVTDNNPMGIEVTLSCNTGLPLQQSKVITEGNGVIFVITNFTEGELDCKVISDETKGYRSNYYNGSVWDFEACMFSDIGFEDALSCRLRKALQQVQVDVYKTWIDAQPESGTHFASADWICYNARDRAWDTSEIPGDEIGNLGFDGVEDSGSFWIFPNYDDQYPTICDVNEIASQSGVESNDEDCQDILLEPGQQMPGAPDGVAAECTLVNTRFFEGIPTLSRYGIATLALLMLGLGLIGFRRFTT